MTKHNDLEISMRVNDVLKGEPITECIAALIYCLAFAIIQKHPDDEGREKEIMAMIKYIRQAVFRTTAT